MLWSQLPMHVFVMLSRQDLDSLADVAVSDPANAHRVVGCWAGFYRIDGVEVIGHTVVFYLGKGKGNYGLARVPSARDHVIFNMPGLEDGPHYCRDFPKQEGFNDPSGMRITGDWFVMYSSYWLGKVDWS